ncbi:O-antigen ligase family protein [Hydrogenophaga soli]
MPAQHQTPQAVTPALRMDQRLALWLFLVAAGFAVLPTGLSWNFEPNPEMLEGSWVRKLQWSGLFGVAALLAWRTGFKDLFRYVWVNPFLWLLMLYAAASAFWSPFPALVVRQMVQYGGVLLIGFVLAHALGDRLLSLVQGLFAVLMAVLLVSALMVLINPTVALETEVGIEGAWRGILEQKNILGIACGISMLLWVYVQTQRPMGWWRAGATLGLIFLCLLKSRSSSSLFFGILACTLYLALFRQHVRAPAFLVRVVVMMGLLLVSTLVGFFLVNDRFPGAADILGPFSALFGKSADLTGRGDIWVYMWQSIESHWWLGSGYASFWLGPGGPSQFIADALRWNVPSAHNGYLDVLNELGLLGLALFALQLLFHLRNLVVLASLRRQEFAFHSGLFIIFLVSNLSESTALRVTSFLQFLFFMSMLMVHHAVYRHWHPAVAGQGTRSWA